MNTVNIEIKPSLMKLIFLTISSMLLAIAVVFVLVLPVGYGIDPTGLGAKLKLVGTTKPTTLAPKAKSTEAEAVVQPASPAASAPPAQTTLSAVEQSALIMEEHQQSFTLIVPPKQNLSFQIYMERDYDLNYQWATDGKPLYAELRGQPQTAKDQPVKVFGKLTESRAKGFFIPPFTGNYSLYWENKTDTAITIHLTAKGAYKVLN